MLGSGTGRPRPLHFDSHDGEKLLFRCADPVLVHVGEAPAKPPSWALCKKMMVTTVF